MAVDTQKFLALPPAKRGGDLATSLKPKKSQKPGGKLVISIKTKIVKASDILKGTLAAEKKVVSDQKKAENIKKRKQQEEELETPDNKDTKNAKKLGIKLPQSSWLDATKNFIFTILFGWAAVRLIDFLPKLVKLLKPLARIADFVIKVGGFILKALVAFVDAGYKAWDWTRNQIGKGLGEGAAQKFSEFSGLMNKMMNTIFILGMTTAAFADALGGINPFDIIDNLRNSKWLRKTVQRGRILGKKTARFVGRRAKPIIETGIKRGTQIVEGIRQSKVGQKISDIAERGKRKVGDLIQGGRRLGGNLLSNVRSRATGAISNLRSRATAAGEGIAGKWNKFKNKLTGLGDKFKNAAKGAWEGMTDAARKKWDEMVEIAARQRAASKSLWSRFKSKIDEGMEWAGKGLKGLGDKAKAQLMEKLVTPFKNLIAPIGKWADETIKPIWKAISGSPAFKWITEALQSKGVSSLAGKGLGEIAQKVGAKAIPVIGGFVNLWFAKDRWGMGDKFGAGIEGLAGILDIASAIAPPLGVPALVLDGYMLVRDLVPQVKDLEDNLLKKFGSTFDGIKSKASEFSNKLSGVSKMFMGDKTEGDKELPTGTGITPINVSDVQTRNNGDKVSTSASYENGSNTEVVVDNNSGNTSTESTDNKNELVVASNGSSDSTNSDLFYKNGG